MKNTLTTLAHPSGQLHLGGRGVCARVHACVCVLEVPCFQSLRGASLLEQENHINKSIISLAFESWAYF